MSEHTPRPKADPTAMGIVSQVWGGVEPAGLADALALQAREPEKKLGQALLECGAISAAQLADVLHKQAQMRRHPNVHDVECLLDYATHRTQQAADALDALAQDLRQGR